MGSLLCLNWIVRKLLITAVVADEGEAAQEN